METSVGTTLDVLVDSDGGARTHAGKGFTWGWCVADGSIASSGCEGQDSSFSDFFRKGDDSLAKITPCLLDDMITGAPK